MTKYYKIEINGVVIAVGTSDHAVSNEITKEEYERLVEELKEQH